MKSQDKILRRTGLPKSWTSALFKHFQVLYGHKFVSAYEGIEDFAAQKWSEVLKDITAQQIKEGLRKCGERKIRNGQEDWPPTPAEFRAMCIPERVEPIHRDYISLPRPAVDHQRIEDAIANMRKILSD